MNIFSIALGFVLAALTSWAALICAKRKGRDTGYWAAACFVIPALLFVIELSVPTKNALETDKGASIIECISLAFLCLAIAVPIFIGGIYAAQELSLL